MPSTSQHLYYNGRLLTDATRTLEQYNMKDDDMVAVHVAPSAPAPQPQPQQQQQQRFDSEVIRLQVLGSPELQQELRNTSPGLYEAMNDPDRFREEFARLERERAEREREKQREIVLPPSPQTPTSNYH
jgi:DNA damage-inducible protein 1